MEICRLGVWLGLLCLGCQSVGALEAATDVDGAALLWQKGQEAMRRGCPEEAITCYQQSLALDPALVQNHLSLAAAYMEKSDEAQAHEHLQRYVGHHPDNLQVRIFLADLKLRLQKLADAQSEFERCVAGAQERQEPSLDQLLHCHARLMEIAEASEDAYAEHLHRGIGLSLLARQRSLLPDPEGELSVEGLLCQAAGELTLAQQEQPDRARPSWYLHQVWVFLDQRQPALRCLRQAQANALFSDLTPAEHRDLKLRCGCLGESMTK